MASHRHDDELGLVNMSGRVYDPAQKRFLTPDPHIPDPLSTPSCTADPPEADMQAYFQVTPPSVHRMVIELERRGLIRRQPGQARSIELLVEPEALPILR